ncbi:MAG TPA: hypothetical protein GXX39_00185 [Syntrophothermus lipocalidus]|nr:hypothetical protein [Syntrophothermus lipocalidus]
MRETLGWGLRLFVIHLFFIFIVWLASYFPGLDLLFSLTYLWVIWQAGVRIGRQPVRWELKTLLAGIVAQSPGFFLTVANIKYYWGTGIVSGDYTFAFELWHTPALPWLSLFSFPVYDGFKSYFLALFLLSPLYLALLLMAGYRARRWTETSPREGLKQA